MVDNIVTTPPSTDEWQRIARALQAPFEPSDVDFRVQGRANEQTGRAQVVAYVDARVVQDRLDSVVGAGGWSFDWTPLVVENGEVMIAKGTLAVHGVSKSDAGSASNFEQSLGAVSHCFKRAAVHWGIGRYLYSLPMNWVSVEKGGRLSEATLRELRAKLPRPERARLDQPRPIIEAPEQPAEMSAASERRRQPARSAPVVKDAEATYAPTQPAAASAEPLATEQQLRSITKLCAALQREEPAPGLTLAQARELISQLSAEYQRARRAS